MKPLLEVYLNEPVQVEGRLPRLAKHDRLLSGEMFVLFGASEWLHLSKASTNRWCLCCELRAIIPFRGLLQHLRPVDPLQPEETSSL